MHPEILRDISAQRGRDMRDRAHRILLAQTASKILRARRRGLIGPGEADDSTVSVMSAIPAVPDFVDGSFLPGPADGRTARGSGERSARGRTAGACEACGTAGAHAA
jgi:hypothetical protein